jgi:diacylglycerol kinase (ATP)
MEKKPAANELHRLINATRNSLAGYRQVFLDEAAFRFQCLILLIILPLVAWLARSLGEAVMLIGVWLLVLLAELGNSAIEAAIDRVSEERHPLSAKAKDAGSAMVMTAMIIAALVWLAFLFDRLA